MRKVYPITNFKLLDRIMQSLRDDSPRNHLLFAFGLYTGKRISDYIDLTVADVKNKDKIALGNQKRKRGAKETAIDDKLKSIINVYVEGKADHEYLFTSRNGNKRVQKHITPQQVNNILNAVGEQFGVHISPHVLRKTFGLYLYIVNGYNPEPVKRALDQKDIYATMSYIGISDDKLDNQLKDMKFGDLGDVGEAIKTRFKRGLYD